MQWQGSGGRVVTGTERRVAAAARRMRAGDCMYYALEWWLRSPDQEVVNTSLNEAACAGPHTAALPHCSKPVQSWTSKHVFMTQNTPPKCPAAGHGDKAGPLGGCSAQCQLRTAVLRLWRHTAGDSAAGNIDRDGWLGGHLAGRRGGAAAAAAMQHCGKASAAAAAVSSAAACVLPRVVWQQLI